MPRIYQTGIDTDTATSFAPDAITAPPVATDQCWRPGIISNPASGSNRRKFPAICQGRRPRLGTPANGFYSHNAHEIRIGLDGGFALDGELFAAAPHRGELILDAGGQAAFLRLAP